MTIWTNLRSSNCQMNAANEIWLKLVQMFQRSLLKMLTNIQSECYPCHLNDLGFWYSRTCMKHFLSYQRDHLIKFSIYHCQDPVYEIWLKFAQWFQSFKNVNTSNPTDLWPRSLNDLGLWYSERCMKTFFHIKEYHCFGKIQRFPFPSFKRPRDQIWPSWKVGQGQHRFTIWTNLLVLSHLMLHIKFQGNQPSGPGEEDF